METPNVFQVMRKSTLASAKMSLLALTPKKVAKGLEKFKSRMSSIEKFNETELPPKEEF